VHDRTYDRRSDNISLDEAERIVIEGTARSVLFKLDT